MNKLQVSMKGASAKKWSENRHYFRVGSYMKGCAHCGDTKEVETPSGGVRIVYTSGFQVFRTYDPQWMGCTWFCWECGAKDLQCWSPDQAGMIAAELSKPPVQGSREAKASAKYALRKSLPKMDVKAKVPTRNMEIARLENELARLMAAVKEMAK